MTTIKLRTSRGETDVNLFAAREAKNQFAEMFERAMSDGVVAISRHSKPQGVLMSMTEFKHMMSRIPDPLKQLQGEFDAMLARMQTPRSKAGGRALFAATPERLGSAAVTGRAPAKHRHAGRA